MVSPILTLWSKREKSEICCYTNFTYSHLILNPCYSSCCISTSHFPLQPVGFLQREDNGQVKWERWFSRLFSCCSNLQENCPCMGRQAEAHITERVIVIGGKWINRIYFILVIPNIFDGNTSIVPWILIKMPLKKMKGYLLLFQTVLPFNSFASVNLSLLRPGLCSIA